MKRIQINIRLKSQDDIDKIDKHASAAGLKRSEYIRKSALRERSILINTDKKAIRDIRVELAREGNNLNQIAKVLNTYGIVPDLVFKINIQLNQIEELTNQLFEITSKTLNR